MPEGNKDNKATFFMSQRSKPLKIPRSVCVHHISHYVHASSSCPCSLNTRNASRIVYYAVRCRMSADPPESEGKHIICALATQAIPNIVTSMICHRNNHDSGKRMSCFESSKGCDLVYLLGPRRGQSLLNARVPFSDAGPISHMFVLVLSAYTQATYPSLSQSDCMTG